MILLAGASGGYFDVIKYIALSGAIQRYGGYLLHIYNSIIPNDHISTF